MSFNFYKVFQINVFNQKDTKHNYCYYNYDYYNVINPHFEQIFLKLFHYISGIVLETNMKY